MGNYSIKKTGGFQLGHGYTVSPVFSDDGCIFAVQAANKRKATIWDVNLKKQIQYCNFSFKAFNLSISANGNRIASRSDGVLEIMDTTTGHCIRSIKKNNLAEGDELQINTKGNLLFDVSNGLKAGFMIWDIETGMCIYQVPFDG